MDSRRWYQISSNSSKPIFQARYVVLDIFSPGAGNLECGKDDPECGDGIVFPNNIDKWTYAPGGESVRVR